MVADHPVDPSCGLFTVRAGFKNKVVNYGEKKKTKINLRSTCNLPNQSAWQI
jgi:hypothetical protein